MKHFNPDRISGLPIRTVVAGKLKFQQDQLQSGGIPSETKKMNLKVHAENPSKEML